MATPFTARRLSIVPTTKCTLRCKLCCNFTNGLVRRRDLPLEALCGDIDRCFELFDRVEWLQFVGGEVFAYPDFGRLLDYARKYRDRFDRIIIESNATIFPDEQTRDAILRCGEDVTLLISDYGALSRAREQFGEFLTEHQIAHRVSKYYGEDQYFNGWIDNTALRDLHEPGDVLEVNAQHCPHVRMQNMICFDGGLYACVSSAFMQDMGVFPPQKGDYVDLRDDSLSLEEKRALAADFYVRARHACRYCMWKYAAVLPRHPAAEQREV